MKKLFILFAAVLMAGSMMAQDGLIKFDDIYPVGSLDGVTFGEGFELTITDNDPNTSRRKVSIDQSSATFGFSETNTISFTYRLKTGAKSSDANKMTLVVPEEGPLVIYARTTSSSATDRYFVIANGSDTIVKHICLETDTVEDASSKIFLPVIVENVPAGIYDVTYNNAINFYGFQLGYDEPADPIELEFTSSETEVGTSSVIVILSGPDVEVVYETHFDNKSIAGIHNNAMQPYIDVTYNGEWESISEGTAEFTFLNVNESGVYTYKLTLNLVGDSGTEFFGEAEIELEGDFSNDVTPTALENNAVEMKVEKTIENGQVVILRNDKKFTLVGAEL